MPDRNHPRAHELFAQHLAELKLTRIAETYREVLDEAARKNSPTLDILAILIADEVAARRERALQRRIQHRVLRMYVRPSLLLLDELGYLPIDKRGANLLFQVVAARYESGAIVLTTNRPFRDWGQTFDVDNTLATAMIDRLMHHGEAIVIQGDSYRQKDKGSE